MRETGKKSLLLFAGINGAGKTSLYDTIKSRTDLGVRVSLDEIAKSMGDWKDPAVQVRAGCEALLQVRELIKEGKTFNQETTLPGMVMVSQLSDAKKAGYTIVLYFVGVQGVEIAINRIKKLHGCIKFRYTVSGKRIYFKVKKRIERGGHGISEEVIRKRYVNMPKALSKILPLCDRAFFYDNTERFRQIAYIENNNFADIDPNLPDWFYYVTGRSNGKQ